MYTYRKNTVVKDNYSKYVCFELNEQKYGIEIEYVLEVISVPEITPVVHTPEFIKGVINLRGEIIAIIDLKVFFLLKKTEICDKSKIVVVSFEDKNCGIIVDAVSQLKNIESISSESIPVTISGKIANFLKGVVQADGKPLIIFNLANIMNSEEIRRFE